MHQLQPKSATKGEFFFFLPYIFVFNCFELASRLAMANEADEVLLGKQPR